jgi:tRNA dimethylallyltransferase
VDLFAGSPALAMIGWPCDAGQNAFANAASFDALLPPATARVVPAPRPDSRVVASSLSPRALVDPLDQPAPDHPLVAIVGPTASGKSALALTVAGRLRGEVVNFDSVQVYRGFDIGSGKLSVAERRGILHHLVDIVEPHQVFTAGDYRREGLRTLESVRERGKLPVLVGGTGFYLRALLLGLFDGPARSEQLRLRLVQIAARHGRKFLHRMLLKKDPESAVRIHPHDTQKIVRALEVCLLTRKSLSALLSQGRKGLSGFRVAKVGLSPPRAELGRRIDARVIQMFDHGLIDEVQTLVAHAGAAEVAPLGALGYRQAGELVAGKTSLEEAIQQTQHATRQYAKRQMTWFRREPGVRWFSGFGDDPEVARQVLSWLEEELAERSLDSTAFA